MKQQKLKIQISKTWPKIHIATKCVCETQILPIMANSSIGQDHKDKHFDISRKIVLQEMNLCNIEALIVIISYVQCHFCNIGHMSRSKV